MELKSNKDLVNLLRKERENQNVKQEVVAAACGLSRASYGHIEQYRTKLTAENLIKALGALGYTVLLVKGDKILK